jgi:DNA-binding MarR family transcriptional regulator
MIVSLVGEGVEKLLEEILKRLQDLEKRLDKIEKRDEPRVDQSKHGLTPALLRTLATVKELGGHGTPESVASRLGIPRNIASLYLNRLSKIGYLRKDINPDPRIRARYSFRLKEEAIDSQLERLINEIRNTYQRVQGVHHDGPAKS